MGFANAPEVLFIRVGGTGHVMSSETIVAASGLIGLGAAVVTGVIWNASLVATSRRLGGEREVEGQARDAASDV
ncbi:MAG: hypothetical protein QOG14_1565 [Mycobacterium sp.]|jgi:hypothetical protein|nr:hypothetical protein [Mycobacterium sp.]